jgi:hypothetical protein
MRAKRCVTFLNPQAHADNEDYKGEVAARMKVCRGASVVESTDTSANVAKHRMIVDRITTRQFADIPRVLSIGR